MPPVALVAALLMAAAPADPPRARVETGALAGVREGAVESFKGVPYAAAPTGDRRWRAPAPAPAWRGVRDASRYGAACPQEPVHKEAWAQVGPQSEDCLFLNVWRPAGARQAPVMVFIHGGGFTYGSAGVPLYDGAALARRGVLVVTLNYRLGRLGFFAHPALTRETPDGPLGDYAFMDQLAALRWVQRNIAALGGDPRNVTLFGESAGAGSVQIFMTGPEAKGLFAKAVSQSGAGLATLAPIRGAANSAEAAGVAWAEGLGLHDPTPAQLRAIPLAEVVKGRGFPFIDGRIVVRDPGQGFRAGDEAPLPFIIGATTYEASLAANTAANAKRLLGPAYDGLLAAYGAEAAGGPVPAEVRLAQQALSIQASMAVAQWHVAHGGRTFAYSFAETPADGRAASPGAPHGGEMAYLFGNQPAGERWDAHDRAVSIAMGDAWVRFAKTGDPGALGGSPWPATGAGATAVMRIADPSALETSTPLELRTRAAAVQGAERMWRAAAGAPHAPD